MRIQKLVFRPDVQSLRPTAVLLAFAVSTIPPLLLLTVLKDGLVTSLYIPSIRFANKQVDYLSDPNPSGVQD